jgi:hypothetical protein
MNGFYSEIVVDWLDLEGLPILRKIYGHQRGLGSAAAWPAVARAQYPRTELAV